uniref:Uncharacterized protein n=1 Tax=Peronospora matthiolae TaxID=2874970 RepID=A0AAV1T344_9STRA
MAVLEQHGGIDSEDVGDGIGLGNRFVSRFVSGANCL